MRAVWAVALASSLTLSGCSLLFSALDRAVDGAVSGAADSAGRKVGAGIGDQIGRSVNAQVQARVMPQVMQAYAMSMFSVLYYQGGYAFAGRGYKPGEYTVWKGKGLELGDRLEKAFLKREADGKEWWRVRADARGDDGTTETSLLEALFSKPDPRGVQQIVRLRARMPGEKALQEVPVQEQSDSWVLHPATRLTADSMAGATVGTEQVTVPAGRYKARHVRFGSQGHQADYWLADTVPGGLVQYRLGDGTEDGWLQLQETGVGATLSP